MLATKIAKYASLTRMLRRLRQASAFARRSGFISSRFGMERWYSESHPAHSGAEAEGAWKLPPELPPDWVAQNETKQNCEDKKANEINKQCDDQSTPANVPNIYSPAPTVPTLWHRRCRLS